MGDRRLYKLVAGSLALLFLLSACTLQDFPGTLPSVSDQQDVPVFSGQAAVGTFATEFTPQFGLIFIVEEGSQKKLSAFLVICGGSEFSPEKVFLGMNNAGLNALDLLIQNGAINLVTEDITLTGSFTDAVTIEGQFQAKSTLATEQCGLPDQTSWVARCGQEIGLTRITFGGGREFDLKDNPCK